MKINYDDKSIKVLDDDLFSFYQQIKPCRNTVKAYQSNKLYDDRFFVFDTETSQITHDGEVYAKQIMFQTYTEGTMLVQYERNQFMETLEHINSMTKKRTIIYVHNLTFDIYFLLDKMLDGMVSNFIIRGKIAKLEWKNIEFRCSFLLTRMSLASFINSHNLSPELDKTDGWDYNLVRSIYTSYSPDEIKYACIDVIGLYEALKCECRLHGYNIAQLPMTTTGYVRRDFNKEIIALKEPKVSNKQKQLRKYIKSLKLPPELYNLMIDCYRGGISGTNPLFKNQLVDHVLTFDITSEYPTTEVLYKFPSSTPVITKVTPEQLMTIPINGDKGFIADITLYNLEVKEGYNIPILIKYNGMEGDEGVVMNSSRIYYADKITVKVNSIDFFIMCKMYTFSKMEINTCAMFDMDFLPKEIVQYILKQYKHKTKYKDEPGKETEYLLAKIRLNSIYGMFAQNPVNTEYDLTENGIEKTQNITAEHIRETLEAYNKKNRGVYFLWGQYTSSYGHLMLYEGMKVCKDDLINCDTDSLKMKYKEEYVEGFNKINDKILLRIEFASKWHKIPIEEFIPKTREGVPKPIGLWENEDYDYKKGHIKSIISKRSKCYLNTYENGHKATVAGINGDKLLQDFKRLVDEGKYDSIESAFQTNFSVEPENSGKLTHLYKNEQPLVQFTDYQGNVDFVDNTYGVTLTPAPFEYKDNEVSENLMDLLDTTKMIQHI